MLAVRVKCPFCNKSLKLKQPPVPGRRLLCSGCNRTFPVRQEMLQSPDTHPSIALTQSEIVSPPASAVTPPPAIPLTVPARATAPTAVAAIAEQVTPVPGVAPTTLPSTVLTPVPPPASFAQPGASTNTASRRALLVLGIVAGLLLLIGSTVLALSLAASHDRKIKSESLAVAPATPDSRPTGSTPGSRDTQTPRNERYDQQPPRLGDPSQTPRSGDRNRDLPRPRLGSPSPRTPARAALPKDLQEQVNKAIDRGVKYLKSKQLVNGTWENSFTTGLSALPGLTLLECGVPASDERVQKAARFVRSHAAKLNVRTTTYEVSLSLLFLDRLGDSKDKPLIRTLAMRLVAGQQADGGWTYSLPLVSPKDETELVGFLEQTRPRLMDRAVRQPSDGKLELPTFRPDPRKLDGFAERPGAKPGQGVKGNSGNKPGSTKEIGGNRGDTASNEKNYKPLSPDEAKKKANKLPAQLRNVPAVVDATGKPQLRHGGSDNSNTQFATLALWAAKRHGLPLGRSLDLLAKRFKTSQLPDGSWGYHTRGGGRPAMTGVGLLGLAVGHGIANDPNRKARVKDVNINKGLKALARSVGKPGEMVAMPKGKGRGKARVVRPGGPINMYFLWTVERVGVLYDVTEMDGKDWYRWGVELLLPTQENNGCWHRGTISHGPDPTVSTCFALLFLKRANLAEDLTRGLEFMVEGKPRR